MSVRTAPQIADPRMEGAWRTQQTTGPYTSSGAVNSNMPSGGIQVPTTGAPWAGPMGGNLNVNVQQANKNSFMNSLMSPEALAALGMGGLGFVSNMLSSRNDGKERQLDRDLEMRRLLAGIAGDDLVDQRTRQQLYLGSMGMDPVSQSRDLFSANLLRDIAGRGPQQIVPGQGNVNKFTPSESTMGFLSEGALAENAGRFYGAAGALDPNQARPDMSAMGFGPAGAAQQGRVDSTINDAAARHAASTQARRDALLGSIEGTGGPSSGNAVDAQGQQIVNPDPSRLVWDPQRKAFVKKDDGGSKMGTFGKILGMAAPFALMAVPGLQGAGIGMMAARAGASAGIGMATAKMQGASGRQALANGAINGGMSVGGDYFNRRPGPATPPIRGK